MKKYLIIETFPNSPHIEASIEIAINLRKQNNKVYFFWCGYDLPWTDWKLSLSKKILSFSFENKIKRLESYLISKNVEVIPPFNLNTSEDS